MVNKIITILATSIIRRWTYYLEGKVNNLIRLDKWSRALVTCWIVGLPLTLTLQVILSSRASARACLGMAPEAPLWVRNMTYYRMMTMVTRDYVTKRYFERGLV